MFSCASLVITEKAVYALAGQMQVAGRFALTNFAHVALLAEVLASALGALGWSDALGAFYWGVLPAGVMTASIFSSVIYQQCSTILLAGYWVS